MGDRLAHSSATGRWARAPAASASASATIIAEGEHASRMSRVAAFALGSATSGVGYLRLRERTWERPSALASGLRAVQDEIPGSTPIPQVRTAVHVVARGLTPVCTHSRRARASG